MCQQCDELVELLEQTKGINSGDFTYVQTPFPNFDPKLVKANDETTI